MPGGLRRRRRRLRGRRCGRGTWAGRGRHGAIVGDGDLFLGSRTSFEWTSSLFGLKGQGSIFGGLECKFVLYGLFQTFVDKYP